MSAAALLSEHVQHVTYYPPFTHYATADVARIATLCGALGVAIFVGALAGRRWKQGARSATVFLAALAGSGFVHACSAIVSLGHPPVWYLIYLRLAVIAATYLGGYVAVSEARKGLSWTAE